MSTDNFVESKISPESTHGEDVAARLLNDAPRGQMTMAQNERGVPDIATSPIPVTGFDVPTLEITGTGMAAPLVAAQKALELQRK